MNNHITEKVSNWRSSHRGRGQRLTGILLSLLGFFWLAKKAGWMPIASGTFWPILLLGVGILMVAHSRLARGG